MTKRRMCKKYNVLNIVGVFVVVTAILWCVIGIKANALEKADNDKKQYQMQEVQFKSTIKNCLENMGYENAGITITKIMDEDGGREYTVLVHHKYLDAKDSDKVNKVCAELFLIDMPGENMTVNYTIF